MTDGDEATVSHNDDGTIETAYWAGITTGDDQNVGITTVDGAETHDEAATTIAYVDGSETKTIDGTYDGTSSKLRMAIDGCELTVITKDDETSNTHWAGTTTGVDQYDGTATGTDGAVTHCDSLIQTIVDSEIKLIWVKWTYDGTFENGTTTNCETDEIVATNVFGNYVT